MTRTLSSGRVSCSFRRDFHGNLKDIAFRVAPLEKRDALDMTQEIKAHKILGAVRGMPAATWMSSATSL